MKCPLLSGEFFVQHEVWVNSKHLKVLKVSADSLILLNSSEEIEADHSAEIWNCRSERSLVSTSSCCA